MEIYWFVMLIGDQESDGDPFILSGKLYPIKDESFTAEDGSLGIVYPLYPDEMVIDEEFFR